MATTDPRPAQPYITAYTQYSNIGNPNCPVCKACSCYKVCFSGMKGFPKTSSNYGTSQADCARHERLCGIIHYAHQGTLEETM